MSILLSCTMKRLKAYQLPQTHCFFWERRNLLYGALTKKNCIICGFKRPQTIYEVPHSSSRLMVWRAIFKTVVMGSYTFDNGSVSGGKE